MRSPRLPGVLVMLGLLAGCSSQSASSDAGVAGCTQTLDAYCASSGASCPSSYAALQSSVCSGDTTLQVATCGGLTSAQLSGVDGSSTYYFDLDSGALVAESFVQGSLGGGTRCVGPTQFTVPQCGPATQVCPCVAGPGPTVSCATRIEDWCDGGDCSFSSKLAGACSTTVGGAAICGSVLEVPSGDGGVLSFFSPDSGALVAEVQVSQSAMTCIAGPSTFQVPQLPTHTTTHFGCDAGP